MTIRVQEYMIIEFIYIVYKQYKINKLIRYILKEDLQKDYLYILTGDILCQCLAVFVSPLSQVRIAAYPALEVHQALTVPGQVNGAWHNMNVHKIVNYSTLYMAFVLMDQHLLAGVVYFHERQVGLALLVQRLIPLLIMLDSQHKVREHILLLHGCVIRTADLHLKRDGEKLRYDV